jgi:hypothetical protein
MLQFWESLFKCEYQYSNFDHFFQSKFFNLNSNTYFLNLKFFIWDLKIAILILKKIIWIWKILLESKIGCFNFENYYWNYEKFYLNWKLDIWIKKIGNKSYNTWNNNKSNNHNLGSLTTSYSNNNIILLYINL